MPDVTAHLAQLDELGYCIVPGVIPDSEVVRIRQHVMDGHSATKKDYGEMQIEAPAGSVLMMDTRIWHSNANNPSSEPRVSMVIRYAPWWLSTEYGGRNQSIVPRETFYALTPGVQTLFRHRAEDVDSRDVSTL